MQSEKGSFSDSLSDDETPQLHAEFSAVHIDERLLPIYEEHQRHKMTLERQEQADNTKIALQLIAETSAITKRGQFIGGGIAILALIGGLVLVAIDKETAGAAVLVMDAVFVFSQRIVRPAEQDIRPAPKE